MASSDVLAIEPLALDDVADGLALSDAAGWNQNADDCLNRLDLRLAQQGKPPKDRTGLRQPIELFSLT